MSCRSHLHGRCIGPILGLVILVPIISVTAQQKSPPGSPYSDNYSPSMSSVLVVLIGVLFVVGFLSLYLRHLADCLGFSYGRGDGGGGGGNGWHREGTRGLDTAVVDSFPTFLYSDVKVHRIGKGSLECAVCLNEFTENDLLRLLPVCSHVFHPHCIGPWLASHVTCPLCRANLEFQRQISTHPFECVAVPLPHQQLSDQDESEPSDQTTHHDDHGGDVIVRIGASPSPEGSDGARRVGRFRFRRSHSTGHSLVVDCERFTLKLPEEVRNKLVNVNLTSFPAMLSPRIDNYRPQSQSVGCIGTIKPDRWRFSVSPPFIYGPGSTWSPKSEGGTECSNNNNNNSTAIVMNSRRSLFKSIKSPLNRVVRSSDIGERSSDRLWPNGQLKELEIESQ